MDALREAGLASSSAVVGHGGSYEVLREIVDPASPYIGTVAFFPEQYGRGLVELVLRLLHGYQVPPYRYMEHALISRENAESHRGLDDSSLGGPDVI
jgi:ribose transport system substrate-binding protein